MNRNTFCLAVIMGVLALGASNAHAQQATSAPTATDTTDSATSFARNRNVTVRERPRPGFEALGIPAGGFMIFPRLTVSGAYDDNIYATQNTRTSDTIFQIGPQILVKSNWSRHELDFFAKATANRYVNRGTEDTTSYGFGASGRLDVERASNIFAGGSYDRATEPRTSPDSPAAAKSPIQYSLAQANFGGVREFSRLRLSGRVDYAWYSYDNNQTQAGAFLRQDDRDRQQWQETGRAEMAWSPEVSFFLDGTANQIDYRLKPPITAFNRNSSGWNLAVGSSFDITRLIRGEAQIGYLRQSYAAAGFGSTGGLSYRVSVDWLPSPLTTVNVSGSRSVQEAVGIAASGYLATTGAVRVDHELLRNVLLNAHGSIGENNYQKADRSDTLAGAGLGATYLMNQHLGLTLGYDYLRLDSSGTAKIPSYNDNRITLSLTAQY